MHYPSCIHTLQKQKKKKKTQNLMFIEMGFCSITGLLLSSIYHTALRGGDGLPEARGDGEEHFRDWKSDNGHGG